MFVVFGATGQTGSAVADTLLEKKLPVRVVLRSNKAADASERRVRDRHGFRQKSPLSIHPSVFFRK